MPNYNLIQTVILTSALSATAYLVSILYKKWKQERIPSNWTQIGTVTKLKIYPLKSGHRVDLPIAECTEVGLKQTGNDDKLLKLRDRCLIVYGEKDGEFRTARTYPKMVLIDISVHDENHLAIDAPTMRTLFVKIPNKIDNKPTSIKCWSGERIIGLDCGDEAASWLSRYIIERDSGLRLAYHDASERRDITGTHQKLLNYYQNLNNAATGLYSDLSSVSLINQQSVNDLNKKIEHSVIDVENFRSNIVVDGPNLEPYVEDNWDFIKIGDRVILRNVKECTRCIMTCIDENGIRNAMKDPLKTLKTYRINNNPEQAPIMGLNLGVRQTGFIRLGDPVYIAKFDN